jgi:branched-chain amino acid transport system ATP-binding protein
MAPPALEVDGITKLFGAFRAVDRMSLSLESGEIHALIGPNGAGKSTLLNIIAGGLAPDGGEIRHDGASIVGLKPHEIVRAGIARSFQITSIFREFTTLDNVALAIQARAGHSFRFWRAARRDASLRDPALVALGIVGLAGRADLLAGSLAHGEKRALELAMALATRPRLLLLDEPMAGMGPEESASMVRLLAGLKGRLSIVLVEHDMDAVFALADRITVMVYGRVIASAEPEAIRADPEVRRAYLGEEGG